jgi:hypothetical protein
MPIGIREAVEAQCIAWPADSSHTSVGLTPELSRQLADTLRAVRGSISTDQLFQRLRALVSDRDAGVIFVSEPVGSNVVVQSLDSDPGGHAKLLSCSSLGATVRYTHSRAGTEAVVDGLRILNAASLTTPETVRTRSQAAEHGVDLNRPESESAELHRWREALRQSRQAEREAVERAEASEATAEKAKVAQRKAEEAINTTRQYSALLAGQLENAKRTLETKESEAAQKLADAQQLWQQKQSELRAQIKQLTKELSDSNAHRHRAVSARVATESFSARRIETAEAKAKATVQSLKEHMASAVADAKVGAIDRLHTLSGLAEVLCPDSGIVSMAKIDSLPTSCAAVSQDSRRRLDYARVTSELCCGLVRFAAGDDQGRVNQLANDVPLQISWRRLFQNGAFGTDFELRRKAHADVVFDNVIFAYRVGKSIGNYQLSKQMLSLVSFHCRGGLRQHEIAHEATRRRELNVSDDVLALHSRSKGSGRSWRSGVLVSMMAESSTSAALYNVMPKVAGAPGRLTVDFEASLLTCLPEAPTITLERTDADATMDDGGDDDRPLLDTGCDDDRHMQNSVFIECGGCRVNGCDIRHCDDPFCSSYAVKTAKKHGLAFYPGAPVSAFTNNLPRTVGKRAEVTATFLRCADAVAQPDGGLNTGRKGVKWLLKEKPALLVRNLNTLLEAMGEKPIDPGHLYRLVGTRFVNRRSSVLHRTCHRRSFDRRPTRPNPSHVAPK